MMNFPPYNPMISLEAQRQMLQGQLNSLNMQIQQQNAMNQPTQAVITGKIVNSLEEVQGLPCPADGSGAYYPCPTGKRIYVKQIGNDGKVTIVSYIPEEEQTANGYEDRFKSIEDRLMKLEGESHE